MERLISAGASIRATAAKFAVHKDALYRHWNRHVPNELRAAYLAGPGKTQRDLEEMAADESLGLLDHLRIIRGRLYRAFDACSIAGDANHVAALAARLHENLRQAAQLTGEVRRSAQININNTVLVNDPTVMRAIGCIVSAVSPYPEAREAVIRALRQIEGLPALTQAPLEAEAAHAA